MTDRYFAPAGLGTSGSGLTRNNPIYGVSDFSMVQPGDNLILLPGIYHEKFIAPQNNLRIINENAIFDGTVSINGSQAISISAGLSIMVDNSPWIHVTGNIWKKGCRPGTMVFVNGDYYQAMPESSTLNNEATVVAKIAEGEITFITATTNGVTRTLYVSFPTGTNPDNSDIRAAMPRLAGDVADDKGFVEFVDKDYLTIEGEFTIQGFNNLLSYSYAALIENCHEFSMDGHFNIRYCYDAGHIAGGDNVSIAIQSERCWQGIRVGAANWHVAELGNNPEAANYNAGSIEIRDWVAKYNGWVPTYNGDVNAWSDSFNGVGVGFGGGNAERIIVRDGYCYRGGPQSDTPVVGWGPEAEYHIQGSSVLLGTHLPHLFKQIDVIGNRSFEQKRIGLIHALNSISKKINIFGNVCINNKATPAAYAGVSGKSPVTFQTTETLSNMEVNVAHNTLIGGTTNRCIYEFRVPNGTGNSINIFNNIEQDVMYQNNANLDGRGQYFWEASFGTVNIKNNINSGAKGNSGSLRYARFGGLTYSTKASFEAAYGATNDVIGTVTINSETYAPTAGTANPIGTGTKWWGTGGRPTTFGGEPTPDIGIDIGAVQTISHEFHPENL